MSINYLNPFTLKSRLALGLFSTALIAIQSTAFASTPNSKMIESATQVPPITEGWFLHDNGDLPQSEFPNKIVISFFVEEFGMRKVGDLIEYDGENYIIRTINVGLDGKSATVTATNVKGLDTTPVTNGMESLVLQDTQNQ